MNKRYNLPGQIELTTGKTRLDTLVDKSIMRLQTMSDLACANNPNGYYVAISGGKDSTVLQELCIMAGVQCEFVHNHTTLDHPETVYFVRRERQRMEALGYKFSISYPSAIHDGKRATMWSKIAYCGYPTRLQRWCCRAFKEGGGVGRYTVTGVRSSESIKRASRGAYERSHGDINKRIVLNNDNDGRRLFERCVIQGKYILNPIIDWEDTDVWEFIRFRNLPYNPLYNQGYTRVGCVGCPMGDPALELEKHLKYKAAYIRAGERYLKYRKTRGLINDENWSTPEGYYNWWVSKVREQAQCEGQLEMYQDDVG